MNRSLISPLDSRNALATCSTNSFRNCGTGLFVKKMRTNRSAATVAAKMGAAAATGAAVTPGEDRIIRRQSGSKSLNACSVVAYDPSKRLLIRHNDTYLRPKPTITGSLLFLSRILLKTISAYPHTRSTHPPPRKCASGSNALTLAAVLVHREGDRVRGGSRCGCCADGSRSYRSCAGNSERCRNRSRGRCKATRSYGDTCAEPSQCRGARQIGAGDRHRNGDS